MTRLSIDGKDGPETKAYSIDLRERVMAACEADDAIVEELCRAAGVSCCPSAVHRAIARLGITRKKCTRGDEKRENREFSFT